MCKRAHCLAVYQRLARHGMPTARIDRLLVELEEHWEDLCQAGLARDLTPAEAEREADKLLGDPEQLAAKAIDGFRQSSWMGRHPILAVCVLPFFLPPIAMAAVVLPVCWFQDLTQFVPVGDPDGWLNARFLCELLWVLNYAAMTGSALWLCVRGWKAGLGFRWVMALWSWCTLSAMLRVFTTDPVHRSVAMGVTLPGYVDSHTPVILLLHGLVAAWMLWIVQKARDLHGTPNTTST